MEKVITYNLTDDLIQKLGELIEERFLGEDMDLSRLAVVFGGKRPSLFLKRELSRRIKKSFFPPAFFSIDEFVEYLLSESCTQRGAGKVSKLDACYIIYTLAGKIAPEILKGRESFSRFLPWAKEVLAFIEMLDLENVDNKALENIKMNAAIGYDVPQSINELLKNIASLRDAYHTILKDRGTYSRGLMYLTASRIVEDIELSEFDKILFCNFFYLHKTEENIIKHLRSLDKAILTFQGSQKEPLKTSKPAYNLSIRVGFDMQSEVCIVREILKNIKDLDHTVVVLPEPESMVPLLSEISSLVKDFNVSMGYPLRRSSLYTLFESIFRAQNTKKGNMYYTKDYLRVISHPFVKNPQLVHKIEEAGNLFVRLEDIEKIKDLDGLSNNTLKEIHTFLFYSWEKIKNFQDLSHILEIFLNTLVDKSSLKEYPQRDGFAYPMNLKIVEKLFLLKEDLGNAMFSKDIFSNEDIFKIFQEEIENQVISFFGSPLKGLQVLGLFETRSLSFQNVIILDSNESVLPKLKIYEPLIPGEVMLSLGINRLEQEEEIQRYQFMRLISSAKNVFLVYDTSENKERSRFIEEIIWEKEKQAGVLGVVPVERAGFQVSVLPEKTGIRKTPDVLNFLKTLKFSPTSINTYLYCPQRFYYQYVLGLREKDDFIEEPEALHIGKFIHEILEEAFKRFERRTPVIDRKFRDSFFEIFSHGFDNFFARRMKADSFLLKEVMRFRLERFLDKEEKREVEEIVSLEREFESDKFTSRIDRIDRLKDGSLFIIDYKTGGQVLIPRDIKKLEGMEFKRESIKDIVQSFQLPLYLYLVQKAYKDHYVRSGLYSLKTLDIKTFPREKESDTLELCMHALEFIIEEILNLEVPFFADESSGYCKNCPFFYMCR